MAEYQTSPKKQMIQKQETQGEQEDDGSKSPEVGSSSIRARQTSVAQQSSYMQEGDDDEEGCSESYNVWRESNDELIYRGVDTDKWIDKNGNDFNIFSLYKARSGQFVKQKENLSNSKVQSGVKLLFFTTSPKTQDGVSEHDFDMFLKQNAFKDSNNYTQSPLNNIAFDRFKSYYLQYQRTQADKVYNYPNKNDNQNEQNEEDQYSPDVSPLQGSPGRRRQQLKQLAKKLTVDIFSSPALKPKNVETGKKRDKFGGEDVAPFDLSKAGQNDKTIQNGDNENDNKGQENPQQSQVNKLPSKFLMFKPTQKLLSHVLGGNDNILAGSSTTRRTVNKSLFQQFIGRNYDPTNGDEEKQKQQQQVQNHRGDQQIKRNQQQKNKSEIPESVMNIGIKRNKSSIISNQISEEKVQVQQTSNDQKGNQGELGKGQGSPYLKSHSPLPGQRLILRGIESQQKSGNEYDDSHLNDSIQQQQESGGLSPLKLRIMKSSGYQKEENSLEIDRKGQDNISNDQQQMSPLKVSRGMINQKYLTTLGDEQGVQVENKIEDEERMKSPKKLIHRVFLDQLNKRSQENGLKATIRQNDTDKQNNNNINVQKSGGQLNDFQQASKEISKKDKEEQQYSQSPTTKQHTFKLSIDYLNSPLENESQREDRAINSQTHLFEESPRKKLQHINLSNSQFNTAVNNISTSPMRQTTSKDKRTVTPTTPKQTIINGVSQISQPQPDQVLLKPMNSVQKRYESPSRKVFTIDQNSPLSLLMRTRQGFTDRKIQDIEADNPRDVMVKSTTMAGFRQRSTHGQNNSFENQSNSVLSGQQNNSTLGNPKDGNNRQTNDKVIKLFRSDSKDNNITGPGQLKNKGYINKSMDEEGFKQQPPLILDTNDLNLTASSPRYQQPLQIPGGSISTKAVLARHLRNITTMKDTKIFDASVTLRQIDSRPQNLQSFNKQCLDISTNNNQHSITSRAVVSPLRIVTDPQQMQDKDKQQQRFFQQSPKKQKIQILKSLEEEVEQKFIGNKQIPLEEKEVTQVATPQTQGLQNQQLSTFARQGLPKRWGNNNNSLNNINNSDTKNTSISKHSSNNLSLFSQFLLSPNNS